ncbi:MAG: tetratricopeptide repeat protein [Planctomycetota bacterium]|jgi:tetratricopeptide (TPR) repeat protein
MRKFFCIALIMVAAAVFLSPAPARPSYKRGEVFTITCSHDTSQSYACYLPKKYRSGKKYNILYCFSPDARGALLIGLYTSAAEKYDWIIVGSNNAKNGPGPPIHAAMAAMWKDTNERFELKEKGCYSTGFSGGSGMAFWMANAHPNNFLGVIPLAVASSWSENGPTIPVHVSVCFVIGDQDAVRVCRKHEQSLKAKGHEVKVEVFSGGHTLPPPSVTKRAVDWLMEIEERQIPIQLMAEAEKLLEEKRIYEARQILSEIAKKHSKSKQAEAAKKKLEEIDADESLAPELAAGKIFAKAVEQEGKGKNDKALKYYKQVVSKHPETHYASLAKPKVAKLEAQVILDKALKLHEKGENALAEKYFREVIEKYPDSEAAKVAKEKLGQK